MKLNKNNQMKLKKRNKKIDQRKKQKKKLLMKLGKSFWHNKKEN